MPELPLIVDVKRDSLEDGPGIRSVVFVKGCPLRCSFCHNPETQDPRQEISFDPKQCIACGECRKACPEQAITVEQSSRIARDRCVRCGKCTQACPKKALRRVGTTYPVATLTELLLRDRAFYWHSNGGVTLSGGECTLYPDYMEELLKSLKRAHIHITLETSGFFPYETFCQKMLPYVDLIYYDIKLFDAQAHQAYTGQDNQLILGNLKRLVAEKTVTIVPRIPLIPGITAGEENLVAIADFLRELGITKAELLPYNPMGMEKWSRIGKTRPGLPERFMAKEERETVRRGFEERMEKRDIT